MARTFVTKAKMLLHILAAIAFGLVTSHFLWRPIWKLPLEPIMQALMPLLQTIDRIADDGAFWFAPALALSYTVNAPNTLAISMLAGVLIRWLHYKRIALYGTLAIPVLVHLLHWYGVARLKAGAEYRGLPSDLAQLPINPSTGPNGALMIAIYGTFFAIVMLLLRWRRDVGQAPSQPATVQGHDVEA